MNKKLYDLGCKYCSNLVIYDISNNDIVDNGTITFIKSSNKIYGITCMHVVEKLKRYNSNNANSIFKLAITYFDKRGMNYLDIENNFKFPKSDNITDPAPDLAICRLNYSLLRTIKKKSYNISNDSLKLLKDIKHGISFGYPQEFRGNINTKKLKLDFRTCVMLLAEQRSNAQSSNFWLFSEKITNQQNLNSLAGMSGGPIFWSNLDEFGILGINIVSTNIKENDKNKSIADVSKISLKGHYLNQEILKNWLKEMDLK